MSWTDGRTTWPDGSSAPTSGTRTRWPSTSTTARSTSRPPSPASSSASCPSTPTTGTPTTSSSTCGRTPTRWRWSSTAPSSSASRASATGSGASGPGCGSTTGPAHLPRVGRPLRGGGRATDRRDSGGRTGSGLPGAAAPTTSTCSTPEGPPGMPKGVMWRQDDLFARLNSAGFRRYPEDGGPDDVRAELRRSGPGMTLLPACPLMHGTGGFTALECLSEGGRVVTLTSRPFDPVELLDTVEREKVNGLVIVGDAFAKPILAALDAQPRPLGPEQPGGHHLVGGDVERGDQAGPAPPPPGDAAGGRLLVVRGHRHGQLGLVGELGGPHRPVHPGSRGPGDRRRRPRRRARFRPERRPGPGRADPPRLLQGRGQDGGDLPHHRRDPLLGARRLRRGAARTAPSSCWAGGRWSSTPAGRRSTPKRSKKW